MFTVLETCMTVHIRTSINVNSSSLMSITSLILIIFCPTYLEKATSWESIQNAVEFLVVQGVAAAAAAAAAKPLAAAV